ncbi:hypothetical protein NP233_g11307 [Leucocoprinus birnbaumii]|uniref:Uncharacterized protein n=1 Tax=Leucocoprinus birnbaumii TaxID=56174 RepID=A0AAD5YR28_9AGAR|nr:hypothetical protein NP233_g11307 [Leucocoprinus birnbaumii]
MRIIIFVLLMFSLFGATSAYILNNILSVTIAGTSAAGLSRFPRDADPTFEKAWRDIRVLGPETRRAVLSEATEVYSEAVHVVSQDYDASIEIDEIEEDIKRNTTIILEHLISRLFDEISEVFEDLKDIIEDPKPEERSERAKARARSAHHVLDQIRLVYIQVVSGMGVTPETATAQFDPLVPLLVHIISKTGNIPDEHPKIGESSRSVLVHLAPSKASVTCLTSA